jgi:uncharacterized protein
MYRYKKTIARRSDGQARRIPGTVLAFAFAAVIFAAGYCVGNMNGTITIYQNDTRSVKIIDYNSYSPINPSYSNMSYSSIVIPAVDEEGNGLTTLLAVQVLPGEGRILTNIDRLLFWTDTQNSIRTSSKVASNITGMNISSYDIIYTILTNATSVEGPSAGAALTVATIAAFEKKPLNPKVMITGSVNHDGTIGPVGQILPKAKAAKEAGAELLLVPLLNSQEVIYETRKYCEQIGISQICTTEKIPKKVNISDEAGIKVVEVQSIEEALRYFLTG